MKNKYYSPKSSSYNKSIVCVDETGKELSIIESCNGFTIKYIDNLKCNEKYLNFEYQEVNECDFFKIQQSAIKYLENLTITNKCFHYKNVNKEYFIDQETNNYYLFANELENNFILEKINDNKIHYEFGFRNIEYFSIFNPSLEHEEINIEKFNDIKNKIFNIIGNNSNIDIIDEESNLITYGDNTTETLKKYFNDINMFTSIFKDEYKNIGFRDTLKCCNIPNKKIESILYNSGNFLLQNKNVHVSNLPIFKFDGKTHCCSDIFSYSIAEDLLNDGGIVVIYSCVCDDNHYAFRGKLIKI